MSRTRSSGCKPWRLHLFWFFRNFIKRCKLKFYAFIIHFSVELPLIPSCYTRIQRHPRCKGSVTGWITSIWQGGSTQRQGRDLISCPSPPARTRNLSFNMAVICLVTGHNTMRRHLHVMELINNPWCRRCGEADEASAHRICECEASASLRHVNLGSFFLDPEDIKSLIWVPSGTLTKKQGSPELVSDYGAHRTRFKAYLHRDCKGSNPIAVTSIKQGKCSHLVPLPNVSEGVSVRQMWLDTQNIVITLFFIPYKDVTRWDPQRNSDPTASNYELSFTTFYQPHRLLTQERVLYPSG